MINKIINNTEKRGKKNMSKIPDNWYIEKKEYIDDINQIYNKVKGIHRHSKSYYFTDHSISHSIRIAENLTHLFPFLFYDGKEEDMLNDVEKFILFASIFLHDIGIELVNHQKLEEIIKRYENKYKEEHEEDRSKVKGPFEGKYSEENALDFVRKNHHLLSKYWIIENVSSKLDKIMLYEAYSGEKILAKYVANVVESHGFNFEESAEHREITAYGNQRIRMGLLCTLLSLGDALDCDQRRIDYNLLRINDISLESKLHWMKHYYVDGILLTPNLIQIYYSFPDTKDEKLNELYKEYFVHKTKYWIEKSFTIRKEFLFPVGAICRVVDIVKFQNDKDSLTLKEINTIQNHYIDILLEQEKKVKYLQYAKGIIADGEGRYFVPTDKKKLIIKSFVLEKKDSEEKLKTVISNVEGELDFIGSCIDESVSAINYYYKVKVNNGFGNGEIQGNWEDKNKFIETLNKMNEKKLIQLLKEA